MEKLNIKDDIFFSERRGPSEIETAMEIMRSLEGIIGLVKAHGEYKKMNIEIGIAGKKALSIKNHYVKRALLNKIEEAKNLFVS